MSERGRLIWRRVFLNYFIFVRAALGWWSELEVQNFGLMERFKQLLSTDAVLTHRNIFDPTPVLDQANEEDENLQVMSAVVSPRLVLLQLIPYLTVFSAFTVNLCNSPIMLRDPELQEKLPPLFVGDTLTQMAKETLMDAGILPTWQVGPMKVYLYVRRSRGVQYVLSMLMSIIAVIIVFSRDTALVTGVMVLSLVLIAVQCLVACIFPVILVHYLLFPSEKVLHCDVVVQDDEDDEQGEGGGASNADSNNQQEGILIVDKALDPDNVQEVDQSYEETEPEAVP